MGIADLAKKVNVNVTEGEIAPGENQKQLENQTKPPVSGKQTGTVSGSTGSGSPGGGMQSTGAGHASGGRTRSGSSTPSGGSGGTAQSAAGRSGSASGGAGTLTGGRTRSGGSTSAGNSDSPVCGGPERQCFGRSRHAHGRESRGGTECAGSGVSGRRLPGNFRRPRVSDRSAVERKDPDPRASGRQAFWKHDGTPAGVVGR